MSVKQVIVIRKDLKMRRGKEIAQGAHASMAWLWHRLDFKDWNQGNAPEGIAWYEAVLKDRETDWFREGGRKVTLQVSSEAELDAVYAKAKSAGLEVHMITDSGLTEFNGVPTKTCLAIGPDEESKIDAITAELKLY